MRLVVLGACVLAAACNSRAPESPAAPTTASVSTGESLQASAPALPFSGTFKMETQGTTNCPPTCPPTTLRIDGHQEGTATHVGHFTATSVDQVDLVANAATGTFNITAANGDQLRATTVGVENEEIAPGVSKALLAATIVGGTGRFAGASGSFELEITLTIEFPSGHAAGSGSVQGTIHLQH